jgi:hypothetical protein
MNIAEAIKSHGPALGAVGVAVLTFVVANPDCTYDDIVAGFGMGRSTVIRYIHDLEKLSLVARHTQKNDKGLDLATSIKSGVSLVDTSIPQRDTVEPRASIKTGVPLRDTDKIGCPAEIHPESPPLHPHKDILNTNSYSSPTVQSKSGAAVKDKKLKGSQKDPRTNFPAIRAFLSVTKRNPPLNLYDKIIKILGMHPNVTKMQECFDEWTERGNKRSSLKWLTVWYVKGIPTQTFAVINGGNNGGGQRNSEKSGKPSFTDRAKQYDDYYGRGGSQARAG